MDLRAAARQIAEEEGAPVPLFLAKVQVESGWDPNARSRVNAEGPSQLMPETAAELGVDPKDPLQNLRGGARYLVRQLREFKDPRLALAAYNAGPGNVRRYGGIPPFKETQQYVQKVLATANALSGGGGMTSLPAATGSSAPAADPFTGTLRAMTESTLSTPSRPLAADVSVALAGLGASFAETAGLAPAGSSRRLAASPEFMTSLMGAKRVDPSGIDGIEQLATAAVESLGLGGGGASTSALAQGGAPGGGGGKVGIVELGKALQGAGLRIREHPDFGGVGKHSDGSWHYKGKAFDATDWQDPGESDKSWRPRKAFLGAELQRILGPNAEVLHPGNDPSHSEHVHVAIPSGTISVEQLEQAVRARQKSLQRYPFRWAG